MANVDIEAEDMYVDTCALKMVTEPWRFDVVLTLNLYGDILSDLGAGLIGGLGFAPSANLGDNYAIFEPVHGSAPDIAGRDAANPTAMLLSACMMLDYLGMHEKAEMLRNAIVELYRKGVRTKDVGGNVGTAEFTRMVVAQLKEEV
jgi:isocitrate/isopropylmalate dehydrogenase